MRLYRVLYIVCIGLLLATNVMAFRITRPTTFSLPWTQSQINQLNDALEGLWSITNGEISLDIVTVRKEQADAGDIWIIQTGSNSAIQWKSNGHIYTVIGSP